MPPFTAIFHTENDALRVGRAMVALRACDEIIIVDHGSCDATLRVAREYGARILQARKNASPSQYLQSARWEWILCLEPRESLSEGLEATLLEWRSMASPQSAAFSVFLREETANGWLDLPTPQTRLVSRTWTAWDGVLPTYDPSSVALEGELLRFVLP